MICAVLCLLAEFSGCVNVSRSSIRGPDWSIVENGAKIGQFFAVEGSVSLRQLTPQRSSRSKNNKKDKSNRFYSSLKSVLNFCLKCIWGVVSILMFTKAYIGLLIRSLLLRGGIEPNPGPDPVRELYGFQLISQNCRGLTDKKKLARLLRNIFPVSKRGINKFMIACLQETHQIDSFTANLWFRGVLVTDNGERNQKGVAILVPDGLEVCQTKVSGVGRWAIAVLKQKNIVDASARKLVVANIYAPNCHRESVIFFQEFFHELDNLLDGLVVRDESFELAIVGDFNLVLDPSSGASNRATNNAESELAMLVNDAMCSRNLVEPNELSNGGCHTWRRGICLSKLDYIFLSSNMRPNVISASIQWHKFGANFDHAAVQVKIEPTVEPQRGRSFLKLYGSDVRTVCDQKWLHEQLQQCIDQIPTHWNPHLKLEFIKSMVRSKTLELRQMNKFADDSEALRNDINVILLNAPISVEDSNKLESLKLRLAAIEDRDAEALSLKAGVRWREEGERSTRYFLARFKARTDAALMHSIRLIDRIVKGSSNILAVVQQFYRRLYSLHKPVHLADEDFCNNFFANCPTLLREQKQLLARPIDLMELKEALKSCRDSAPGMDGIPYSFYSKFPFLLQFVLDSWHFALQGNGLAESHRRSCISLLPKQGKDLMAIGNWRPISLSACDLKIITKAYANRLKGILPEILCEAQAAYVPGRDISFNNRVIQCARRYAVKNSLDFCLVSLDAQKAFDSVDHEYLIKVMEAYEFPQEFIEVFQTLYSGLKSVVQVNGFLSQEFDVLRGVKQGDALSCGLFVLAIDPLLRNLSQNDLIEGLSVPTSPATSVEIKVLSYADDVTVICKNRSLQQIFEEYESFSKVSGLILNAEKTEVFNFIQSRHVLSRITYMGQSTDLGRVDQIRICGIYLASEARAEYQKNVLDKISAMESMVLSWGRRHLSLNGRMIVAKTFLLSLIVFPAQTVRINKIEVKKIEKLVYAFVNGAKNLYGPERISRINLKAPKDSGGIGGVDVDSFIKAIGIKQFEKAARNHRILGLLQGLVDLSLDDVAMDARNALRNNCRTYAGNFAMPDLNQIELISSIPLCSLLIPASNAARIVAQESIESLGALQEAFNDHRRARTGISAILRALPRPIAALIRSGSLVHLQTKLAWFSSDSIIPSSAISTKMIKAALLEIKFPNIGVKLEKIYKRADWPPPGTTYDNMFKHLWAIKNPTLRASRLKVIYKDIFSNERRFRFHLTDSPLCEICGQIETVEHQLFLCPNARRLWDLFHRMTNVRIESLFDVVHCKTNIGLEIIKSTVIRLLLQINRSRNKSEREVIIECSYYIGIETRINYKCIAELRRWASTLRNL